LVSGRTVLACCGRDRFGAFWVSGGRIGQHANRAARGDESFAFGRRRLGWAFAGGRGQGRKGEPGHKRAFLVSWSWL
jgi:hypothetical protein